MDVLADQGIELPIPPDGPLVRMIDQEIVREQFYAHTPADGTPEQKGEFRRKRFIRALDWAEDQQLIAVVEIDGITYLRQPDPWAQGRRQDQRTAVLRLKRVLMGRPGCSGRGAADRTRWAANTHGRSGDRAGAVLCRNTGGGHASTEGRVSAQAV